MSAGGKRPQGRPPLKDDEPTVTITFRAPASIRTKLVRMGGEDGYGWLLRELIKRAKEK